MDKIRENGFEPTKKSSRRYPAKTITDADYADDIAILANKPNQAETLLHSLEQADTAIGLHVNAHKTEYMCYNQTGHISTLDGTTLKLFDKFTYLGSSISPTENDIDTWLTKAWKAIDRLSIIWKSDLIDKMKCSFFLAAVVSILLYWCTTWTLTVFCAENFITVIRKFNLPQCRYVHIRTNSLEKKSEPTYLHSYGLSSTTTVSQRALFYRFFSIKWPINVDISLKETKKNFNQINNWSEQVLINRSSSSS